MYTQEAHMRGLIITFALLCAAVTACRESDMKRVPDNAVILGETVVVEVHGMRVGSGNYFEQRDSSGAKRKSIQVAIWRPGTGDNPRSVNLTLFEGDEFDIGGKKYRLLLVEPGKGGENGKAWIVPLE
jgi:hypothetical protein